MKNRLMMILFIQIELHYSILPHMSLTYLRQFQLLYVSKYMYCVVHVEYPTYRIHHLSI